VTVGTGVKRSQVKYYDQNHEHSDDKEQRQRHPDLPVQVLSLVAAIVGDERQESKGKGKTENSANQYGVIVDHRDEQSNDEETDEECR